MALVAYGSDSDSDTEAPTTISQKSTPASAPLSKGPSALSSLLPPPKTAGSTNGSSSPKTQAANPTQRARSSKLLTMPTLDPDSEDSDEESGPFAKRQKLGSGASTSGGGLFDMLPAPKNKTTGKVTASGKAQDGGSSSSNSAAAPSPIKLTSLAPRTLKPAGTKTATQGANSKKTKVEDEDEDDDEPVSFFPLGAAVTAIKPAAQQSAAASAPLSYFDKRGADASPPQAQEGESEETSGAQDEAQVEEVEAHYSNEMYAYSGNEQYAYPTNDQYAYDQYAYAGYEGYYDPQAYSGVAATEGASSNTVTLDDKSLQRLGGKGKGMSGAIHVVDVNASSQMQDAAHIQRTMGKSLPKNVDPSTINHLKPSTMQKRKHNIMSLAYQAKANQHTLQAQWSASRQTKAQTQAKYGF
ncbi:hypothetical protein BGZ73_004277 [Actinomortierella ambigua]|nr:hypothetical protein BGZ73_004277 [Actinomortierella ambigua]